MDDKQLNRFRQAVEDKNEDARAASEAAGAPHPRGASQAEEQPELHEPARPQDTRDERAKSSGHGKRSADKWNQ